MNDVEAAREAFDAAYAALKDAATAEVARGVAPSNVAASAGPGIRTWMVKSWYDQSRIDAIEIAASVNVDF